MGSVQTIFHNSDVGGAVKAAQMWRRLKVCNISEWWITISATNFRSEYCSECPHCTKCSWSFLWEGSFWIKFLLSKIKAMWIYIKSVGTWSFLWADRDMIFICRAFHFQNMFSFGRQCFWQFFFKSSYLYLMQQTVSDVSLSKCFLLEGGVFDSFFFQVILSLFDVSCGTDPRIIRHRIHGRYKSVFFMYITNFQISKRAVSSEIIKLDRVLTLNSSSLKQNLVISVCFNYAQVLPKFCTFR